MSGVILPEVNAGHQVLEVLRLAFIGRLSERTGNIWQVNVMKDFEDRTPVCFRFTFKWGTGEGESAGTDTLYWEHLTEKGTLLDFVEDWADRMIRVAQNVADRKD